MYSLLLVSDLPSDDVRSILRNSGFGVAEGSSVPIDDLDRYHLILLVTDVHSTAVEQLRSVRENSNVPLIVVAGGTTVAQRVEILELGADDFLPNSVAGVELLARVKSLLRRATPNTKSLRTLVADDLELQSDSRILRKSGVPVHLTGVEFELLRVLLLSVGNVVTREVISREVFRRRPYLCNRSIDVHMSSLRKKLGPREDGKAIRIRTIRGYGYMYTNGQSIDCA